MKPYQFCSSLLILTGIVAPVASVAASPIAVADSSLAPRELISLKFPDSPDSSGKVNTVGGGHRGGDSCSLEDDAPLTALMPSDGNIKTISDRPSIFFYLPPTKAESAEFLILDEQGNEVYYEEVKLPKQSGLLQLDFPQQVALKSDRAYEWSLGIICDPFDNSNNETISGLWTRFSPEKSSQVTAQLKEAKQQIEEAEIYAQHYIWNETVTIMSQMRDTHSTEWKELLNSVGISNPKIVDAPIIKVSESGF